MIKTYEKQPSPVWERKLVLLLGFLLAATLLLFAFWAVTLFLGWAEADDCLDSGGSYDYEQRRCEPDGVAPSRT